MEHQHRCGGQDSAQFPADYGAVLLHSLDKAVRPCVSCPLMSGHKGCEGGENQVVAYLGGPLRRHAAVLLQRVAARPAATLCRTHRPLCGHAGGGFPLPLGCRGMDFTPAPPAPHGRRVQQRERVLHAGDPPDRERVFRQSAHPFLVQEKDVERLDQCRQSLPRLHRARHARQRKVLRGGQFLHQAAD